MALDPVNEIHALQIQAGILGRKSGHAFEDRIASVINAFKYPLSIDDPIDAHLGVGDPGDLLLRYIATASGKAIIKHAAAISTGALATSEEGKKWLLVNGANINRCKSDLVINFVFSNGEVRTVGVSTKQCGNRSPTNAQLYFTTARGFAKLLKDNGIAVSDVAVEGLRQFCGDPGYRPLDDPELFKDRRVDPRRFFWEELPRKARAEWEQLFRTKQDEITKLLLQKAYIDDRFVPEFLIHKTKFAPQWNKTEVAIYSIEQLVRLSRSYQGFSVREYSVRKGTYKDPVGITHLAPRFGVVQMQRGGQKQHPDQLQFNLEAGYFYKI